MKILRLHGKKINENSPKAEILQNHNRRRWKISQIAILMIVVGDHSILDTVAKDISMVAMEFVIFCCVAMEFVDFSSWLLW